MGPHKGHNSNFQLLVIHIRKYTSQSNYSIVRVTLLMNKHVGRVAKSCVVKKKIIYCLCFTCNFISYLPVERPWAFSTFLLIFNSSFFFELDSNADF